MSLPRAPQLGAASRGRGIECLFIADELVSPLGCRDDWYVAAVCSPEPVVDGEQEITLAADGGVIAIPYSEIRRSNLVEE